MAKPLMPRGRDLNIAVGYARIVLHYTARWRSRADGRLKVIELIACKVDACSEISFTGQDSSNAYQLRPEGTIYQLTSVAAMAT